MRWHVSVNVKTRLRVRTGPGTSYRIVGYKYNGNTGIVVDSKTSGGLTWYKWEDTGYWSCAIEKNSKYLNKIYDLEEKPEQPKEPEVKPKPPEDTYDGYTGNINVNNDITGSNNLNGGTFTSTWYQPNYKEGTPMSFLDVDYNVAKDDVIAKEIAKIKYNMDIGYRNSSDIYSDYNKDNISKGYFSDLQKKLYNSFNRNKIAFPDKELNKTFAYVFFTRPDLNILQRGATAKDLVLTKQVSYDKKYQYLWENNPWCLKSLVQAGNSYHKFMVFLSNEALSFEVGDVVLKTIEHGETFNGHKIIYGRSDIESNVAGEMSIRYVDTVNLDVFKLHLAWVDYINKVSRGVFCPKRDYIKSKILDYASSCYYFLCGPDGSTILYWQKLTGVFPTNTSENTFSWDSGTLLAKPEINIKYSYSFKNTMDPIILSEFNMMAATSNKRKTDYDPKNLHTGSTLSHSPRVEQTTDPSGNRIFRLMWVEN